MAEKPIIFSGESIVAILRGTKTQTRRIIKYYKKSPSEYGRDKFLKMVDTLNGKPFFGAGFYKDSDVFVMDGEPHVDAVYYKAQYNPGDIVYVKEVFSRIHGANPRYVYKSTDSDDATLPSVRWRSPYYMPKSAARTWLKIADVKVERLGDISKGDCIAEGITEWDAWDAGNESFENAGDQSRFYNYIRAYKIVWNQLNGKRNGGMYSWDKSPWVWVYTFERIDGPHNV